MNRNEDTTKRAAVAGRFLALIVCGAVTVAACVAGSDRAADERNTPHGQGHARLKGSDESTDPVSGVPGTTGAEQPQSPSPRRAQDAARLGDLSPAEDSVLARGRALFAKNCALCHGEVGDGGGKFAYLMNPRPRNLQQGNFKLSTTENQIPSDGDLFRTISNGMPGSAMPPWGHLPKADIEALAAFVRWIHLDATRTSLAGWVESGSLAESEVPRVLAERTTPGPALVVPAEAAFDEIRWFRGRRIYLEMCASCHGANGEPVPDAVKFDNEGYPVPPRSFVQGIFKGGSQGHQLYARIWKGMKGTPMPASEGAYSGDEMWDVIHYVQSLMRQGAQERAQLRQGTFVAPRVSGALPEGPMDPAWSQARPMYVGLTPLWWEEQRIEGLVVSAVHNGEQLAMLLSWIDPTIDDRAVKQTEFRDAVAIQFSLTSDPPFYMGSKGDHGGVNIWMWKADRQTNITAGYQDVDSAFPERAVDLYPELSDGLADLSAVERPYEQLIKHDPMFITAWGAGNLVADPNLKTPVECLVARGPGTLSAKPANVQLVEGQAVYQRGLWYVQMQRSMDFSGAEGHGLAGADDERLFKPGDYLPVSFAVWNGSAGDRDGKKNISIWQKLVIE